MRIEREPVQLRTLNLDQVQKAGRLTSPGGGPPFPVNSQQMDFLRHLHQGKSIHEVVNLFFQERWPLNFACLRDLIAYLTSEGIILNSSFRAYFSPPAAESRGGLRDLWDKVFGTPSAIHLAEETAKLPFFRSLAPGVRDIFLKHAKVAELPPQTRLCQARQKQRVLFALLRGDASILKPNPIGRPLKVGSLASGAVFGETGFFLGEANNSDVVTENSCVVLYVTYASEAFDKLINMESSRELQLRCWAVQALKNSRLFGGLPNDCFDALIMAAKMKTIPAQRWICKEGDSGNTCYVILSGHVEVTKGGKQIRSLGPGDCFGELALVATGGVRSASVYSSAELLVMEIPDYNFYEMLAENLFLACQFEKIASARMKATANLAA